MRKLFLFLIAICFFSPFVTPVWAVDLHAFGDITYEDNDTTGGTSGFGLGQLDFWATHRIDEEGKMKAFLEIVVENADGWVIDLERLWVEYTLRSNIAIRGGRFHTSLGYWNREYHHGAHMQLTTFRPLFLDFEDGDFGIFPSHSVGLMGVADFDTGAGFWHYELQYGNGSTFLSTEDRAGNITPGEIDPKNVGDVDDGKGIAMRLKFFPSMVEGLGFGVSGVFNKVNEERTNDLTGDTDVFTLSDQRITAFDVSYVENNFDLIF